MAITILQRLLPQQAETVAVTIFGWSTKRFWGKICVWLKKVS